MRRLLLILSVLISATAFSQPAITSFAPTSALAGAALSITGTGFNANAADNIVYFGAVRATVTSASATQLGVTVPTGATFGTISVLNKATGLMASSAVPFMPEFSVGLVNPAVVMKNGFAGGGTSPIRVVTVDMDNDGKPDIVVLNQGSDNIAVMRNRSVPRRFLFGIPVTATTLASPTAIAAGDLNGDGKQDIVVANTAANSISVFLNTTTDTTISFAARTDISMSGGPSALAINDLDRDGRPDIIVVNTDDNKISILPNTSTGGNFAYGTISSVATGTKPIALVVRDLNGDNKADIAITNQTSNTITVLKNACSPGNFGFIGNILISSDNNPSDIAAGDINGDGLQDLVVTKKNGTITIFTNASTNDSLAFPLNGSNVYTLDNTINGDARMSLTDFDGDGKLDITATSGPYSGASIRKNSSSGVVAFGPFSMGVQLPNAAGDVSAADIDGDGRPDIVAPVPLSNNISLIRNVTTSTPPMITSFAPMSAGNGTYIYINGQNLDEDIQSISLGGVSLALAEVLSSTQVRTFLYNNAASGDVRVTGAGGVSALTGFVYLVPPTLLEVAPLTVAAGGAFTITGINLIGTTKITVGGASVASFQVLSNTVVSAVAAATLSGTLEVTTAGGTTAFTGHTFQGVVMPPTLTSFAPTSMYAGGAVTITGTNFTDAIQVKFGTTAAASFTVLSSTTIVARPGVAGSSGDLSVTTAGGTVALSGFTFRYPPGIGSFEPKSAGTGDVITVTGVYLNEVTGVYLGGTAVASFSVLSPGTLVATVGAGATGALSLTSSSGSTSMDGFTFLVPKPVIAAFDPVQAGAFATVTITGSNFTGATAVSFGGKPATSFTVVSSTVITAVVGAGATGAVQVTTAKGTGQRDGFTYVPPGTGPIITGVKNIAAAYLNPDVISGLNFGNAAADLAVYYGGVKATVVSASPASLTIQLPAGASYSPVTVTNKATHRTGYSPLRFITVYNDGSVGATAADFTEKKNFSTAGTSRGTAVVDLDGDGKADVVTTNQAAGSISILRNLSVADTIRFATKIDIATGPGAMRVAYGDLDGDGRMDLVVTNANSGSAATISVLRNTSTPGSISFAFRQNYTAGLGTAGVVIRDMDLDGKPDVVVGSGNSGKISIYPNNSFEADSIYLSTPIDISVSGHADELTVQDINGDGFPEIITADFSASPGTFSIIENKSTAGNISFAGRTAITTLTQPSYVAVADIDNDGKPDVITASYSQGKIAIHRNTVSGSSITFSDKIELDAGTTPNWLTVGDIDGDGRPDLAVPNNTTSSVTVLRNLSSPSGIVMSAPFSLTAEPFPMSTEIADLDGDGRAELLASHNAGISVFRNTKRVIKPVITSFTPTTASAGDTLYITGTGLAGALTVTLGGTAVASFSVLSSTSVMAIVAAGSSGILSVVTVGGTAGLSGFTFVPMTVSSFAPTVAGAGAAITVTGTGLKLISSITLGGTPVKSFRYVSSTQLVLVTGTGSSGALSITGTGGTAGKAGFVFLVPDQVTGDTSWCEGSSRTLTVKTNNNTGSLQWYRNDTLLTGATTASYSASTSGVYKVIRTVEGFAYTSNGLRVTVNRKPAASFVITSDTVQCVAGNRFTFSSKTTPAPATQRWLYGDSAGHSGGLGDSSVAYNKPGTYKISLAVSSDKGCTDTASKMIVVAASPSIIVTQPAAVCNTNGTAVVNIKAASVTAGSAVGPYYSYWTDSTASTSLLNAEAITKSGTYYIKASTDTGCYTVKPVVVQIWPLPVLAAIKGDSTVCLGATIQLQNTTPGGTWSSTNTSVLAIDSSGKAKGIMPGTVNVVYAYTSSATGCSNTVSMRVAVNQSPISGRPEIAGFASDTVVCFPGTITLESKNTYDKYRWSNGATTKSVTVSTNEAMTLKVGSNVNNCYSDSSITVQTHKNITPPPSITKTNDSLVSSVSLSYRWMYNNKLTGDTAIRIPIKSRGVYNVMTTADRVCWNTSNDFLVIMDQSPVQKTFDLSAYPNPTNGPFNVQLKFERPLSAIVKLTLVDQSGTTRWTGKKLLFFDRAIKIPVNITLAKGIYTLRVEVNGEVKTQQIVVM